MGAREQIVNRAIRYNGMSFGGGSHRTLIDEFNKHKPDGGAMTYTADFCAACASAIAYLCGYGDAYPCSYNVGTIVRKAKAMGIWVEDDAFRPSPGDWIIYDWRDTGRGDNSSGASHVGIVVSTSGGYINVFEFNMTGRKTGYRKIAVNGRFIRGFVHPDFSVPGWQHGAHGWWYKLPNGDYYKSTWARLDGYWYYFDKDGYCLTARWAQISGEWYHFDSSGHMETGWHWIGSAWYHFDAKGRMSSGWLSDRGKTYYLNAEGHMVSGWREIDGHWYYFGTDGARLDGAVRQIGGEIYALGKDGAMIADGEIKVKADKEGRITMM